MNNDTNNNHNEVLFFKIIKNKVLFRYLLSFISSKSYRKYHSYNSTVSIKDLLKFNKFEIILDKLKSNNNSNNNNHQIDFDFECLSNYNYKFYNSIKQSQEPIIQEIYNLISEKYKYKYKSFQILEHSIINNNQFIFKNYIKSLFKLQQNNSISSNNNNKCNSSNPIDQKYRLYSLMDLVLQYNNFNSGNIETPLLILELMNSSNNNNNINCYNNNNNSYSGMKFKRQKIDREFSLESISDIETENQVKELIYSDNISKVPIYSNNIVINLISKTLVKKDIVKFIEDHLNIDIGSIIFKYKNHQYYQISIGNILNKNILNQYISILLSGAPKTLGLYNFGLHFYINRIDHAKLYLLEKIDKEIRNNGNEISDNGYGGFDLYSGNSSGLGFGSSINGYGNKQVFKSSAQYSVLKSYLKDNSGEVNTIESLVQVLEKFVILNPKNNYFNIKKENQLYYYLGSFYIYYCLRQNKFKSLQENMMFNFDDDLVFSYSIYKLSVQAFKLCLEYEGFKNFNGFGKSNYYDQVAICNISQEKDKFKVIEYFNEISKYNQILTDSHWFRILKIVISHYEDSIIELLLNENQIFKLKYHHFISNEFKEILGFHLTQDPIKKCINLNKIIIYINQFNSNNNINISSYSNHYHIKIVNVGNVIQDNIITILKSIDKKEYPRLMNLLLNQIKNKENSIIIDPLINQLYYNSQYLDLDLTVQVYNSINQDLLINNYKNNNSFYQNKSNILINHLIVSIINRNINSILKIISILNCSNNSNNNRNDILDIYNNSSNNNNNYIYSILIYLKDYLKHFSFECLLNKLIEKIDIKNYEYQIVKEIISVEPSKLNNYLQLINQNNSSSSGTNSKYCEVLTFYEKEIDISLSLRKGYYQASLEFINNVINSKNMLNINTINSPSEQLIFSLIDNNISIEWFSNLYDPLIKRFLEGDMGYNFKFIKDLSASRTDIFEFLWVNHLVTENDKQRVIIDLFESSDSTLTTHQFLFEYILNEKNQFIKNKINISNSLKIKLHKDSLIFGNPVINQLIRSIFITNSTDSKVLFKIDFTIIKELIQININLANSLTNCRYDIIEYLYEHNLIPNLKNIIGKKNLDKLKIKEFNSSDSLKKYQNDSIIITKSMFILIHTIIKNQEQYIKM